MGTFSSKLLNTAPAAIKSEENYQQIKSNFICHMRRIQQVIIILIRRRNNMQGRSYRPQFCHSLTTVQSCGKVPQKRMYTESHKRALGCTHRANINNMHVNLSWLKVEERLTSSLLLFMVFNSPSCLSKLLAHSSDTHAYPTRNATRGLFRIPKSRTYYERHTALHRAMTTWNSIPY